MNHPYFSQNKKCPGTENHPCGKLISNNAEYCQSCWQKGERNPTYNKKRHQSHFCINNCGNKINYRTWKYGTKNCGSCASKIRQKNKIHKIECNCVPCQSKRGEYKGKNNPGFKDGRTLIKRVCVICGKEVKEYRSRTCSIECRTIDVKIRKIYKSINNPNWQNGISERGYSYKFSYALKEQIRKRDNYICQYCGLAEEELFGKQKKLNVHHIDYNKRNCRKNNLITLCLQCNIKANYNRDYWYAFFKYIQENRICYLYYEPK